MIQYSVVIEKNAEKNFDGWILRSKSGINLEEQPCISVSETRSVIVKTDRQLEENSSSSWLYKTRNTRKRRFRHQILSSELQLLYSDVCCAQYTAFKIKLFNVIYYNLPHHLISLVITYDQ